MTTTIDSSQIRGPSGPLSELKDVAFSGSYTDLVDTPNIPAEYSLPPATNSELGGVMVGQGLNVDGDGEVSVENPLIPQPAASLPDLIAPPDEAWVNEVLKPLLVAAGILQSE